MFGLPWSLGVVRVLYGSSSCFLFLFSSQNVLKFLKVLKYVVVEEWRIGIVEDMDSREQIIYGLG